MHKYIKIKSWDDLSQTSGSEVVNSGNDTFIKNHGATYVFIEEMRHMCKEIVRVDEIRPGRYRTGEQFTIDLWMIEREYTYEEMKRDHSELLV